MRSFSNFEKEILKKLYELGLGSTLAKLISKETKDIKVKINLNRNTVSVYHKGLPTTSKSKRGEIEGVLMQYFERVKSYSLFIQSLEKEGYISLYGNPDVEDEIIIGDASVAKGLTKDFPEEQVKELLLNYSDKLIVIGPKLKSILKPEAPAVKAKAKAKSKGQPVEVEKEPAPKYIKILVIVAAVISAVVVFYSIYELIANK